MVARVAASLVNQMQNDTPIICIDLTKFVQGLNDIILSSSWME